MSEVRVRLPSATSLVARSAHSHVIGQDNRLPWHLKTDLARFKKRTLGHVVVMGRRTFDSIGKPLPNRINVVLSRTYFEHPGVLWAGNLSTALYIAETNTILMQKKEFFVIGGEQIYRLFLPYINKVFLTEVDDSVSDGDARFDVEFGKREWDLFRRDDYPASDLDEYPFSMLCYIKKKHIQRMEFRDKYLRTNPHLAMHIGPYIQNEDAGQSFSQIEMSIA